MSLVRILLLSGLCLHGLAYWKLNQLPGADQAKPEILAAPEQKPTAKQAFTVEVEGITYTIRPLFHYELSGMVVSRHDSDTWWDYIHRAWNDHLNVADLCVIWGENVTNEAYRQIDFSSGQFTCNFFTRSTEAFAAFDQTGISNNHLLTDRPELAQVIKHIRTGDQVRFRGYLAEYSHFHGQPFARGTSTVRTDTGNGACETVFLEDITILKSHAPGWRMAHWLAWAMWVMGILAWWRRPHRSQL